MMLHSLFGFEYESNGSRWAYRSSRRLHHGNAIHTTRRRIQNLSKHSQNLAEHSESLQKATETALSTVNWLLIIGRT